MAPRLPISKWSTCWKWRLPCPISDLMTTEIAIYACQVISLHTELGTPNVGRTTVQWRRGLSSLYFEPKITRLTQSNSIQLRRKLYSGFLIDVKSVCHFLIKLSFSLAGEYFVRDRFMCYHVSAKVSLTFFRPKTSKLVALFSHSLFKLVLFK